MRNKKIAIPLIFLWLILAFMELFVVKVDFSFNYEENSSLSEKITFLSTHDFSKPFTVLGTRRPFHSPFFRPRSNNFSQEFFERNTDLYATKNFTFKKLDYLFNFEKGQTHFFAKTKRYYVFTLKRILC